jgi:hypothetical protein
LIKSIPLEPSLETEINEKGKNKTAKIMLVNEKVIFAKDLVVNIDSVKFFNPLDSILSVFSLENVKEIRFKYHFEGALLGMAAGGYFLNAIGTNNSESGDHFYNRRLLMIVGVARYLL